MTAKKLGKIALFTALFSVSALLYIPIGGVPITLQTFVLVFAACLLGVRGSLLSVLAYLLLGGIGVPVFAGFQGGFSVFLSPTGGFLVGFLPACALIALGKRLRMTWLFAVLGFLALYSVGTVWFALVTGGETGVWVCLTTCVLPFLLPDFVKTILAVFLAIKTEKYATKQQTVI